MIDFLVRLVLRVLWRDEDRQVELFDKIIVLLRLGEMSDTEIGCRLGFAVPPYIALFGLECAGVVKSRRSTHGQLGGSTGWTYSIVKNNLWASSPNENLC